MVTRNPDSARFVHLYRGVYPFLYTNERKENWQEDVEERLQVAIKESVELGILKKGDVVITVQGWTRGIGHSNTMRVLIA
ncbi:unnamed protein product [[Candida] boidinii]|nr:unnamed protein product [[Candida] boidinii]